MTNKIKIFIPTKIENIFKIPNCKLKKKSIKKYKKLPNNKIFNDKLKISKGTFIVNKLQYKMKDKVNKIQVNGDKK